jgi:hypothetical protein
MSCIGSPSGRLARAGAGDPRRNVDSAADLKFLHHLPRFRPGTSNREAALESKAC